MERKAVAPVGRSLCPMCMRLSFPRRTGHSSWQAECRTCILYKTCLLSSFTTGKPNRYCWPQKDCRAQVPGGRRPPVEAGPPLRCISATLPSQEVGDLLRGHSSKRTSFLPPALTSPSVGTDANPRVDRSSGGHGCPSSQGPPLPLQQYTHTHTCTELEDSRHV